MDDELWESRNGTTFINTEKWMSVAPCYFPIGRKYGYADINMSEEVINYSCVVLDCQFVCNYRLLLFLVPTLIWFLTWFDWFSTGWRWWSWRWCWMRRQTRRMWSYPAWQRRWSWRCWTFRTLPMTIVAPTAALATAVAAAAAAVAAVAVVAVVAVVVRSCWIVVGGSSFCWWSTSGCCRCRWFWRWPWLTLPSKEPCGTWLPESSWSTSSTVVYVRCSASCLRLLRNVDG